MILDLHITLLQISVKTLTFVAVITVVFAIVMAFWFVFAVIVIVVTVRVVVIRVWRKLKNLLIVNYHIFLPTVVFAWSAVITAGRRIVWTHRRTLRRTRWRTRRRTWVTI